MLNSLKTWLKTERPELLQIVRMLRYEAETGVSAAQGRLSPRARSRLLELRGRSDLKLHIASGERYLPGWVNVDTSAAADVRMDLRRRLPFDDASVSLVFTEHFLDHLSFPHTVERVLREIRRVLKPGGRLRLVVHDAELLARAYLERDADFFRKAIGGQPPYIQSVNYLYRLDGFHQFIYDFEMLELLLRRVGFKEVIRSSFQHSEVPEFNVDYDLPDRPVQSLYVEAVA